MTGTTIHKEHHWSFFSQVGNEDISQEAEKDLLGNPSIGFFFGGGGGLGGHLLTLPAH